MFLVFGSSELIELLLTLAMVKKIQKNILF
ncbi:hypothetical protein P872_13560 [Rhodonellum psychrophilum GCM71 = DSM 17998]|uniref:Uncharacterized protein n=1 Tax=Rhodonellum psychrophilum GCM71 = DSM 17998 TaxID=1123057 RepID=U5BWV9_9BACT|nr:hypothetical protein P872_13560 [Rhodonellum psychrophilum GCM71 = DSM 17998]